MEFPNGLLPWINFRKLGGLYLPHKMIGTVTLILFYKNMVYKNHQAQRVIT